VDLKMRDHSSEVCYVTDMHLHPEVLFSAIFAGTLVSLDTLTEALVVRGSTLFTFKKPTIAKDGTIPFIPSKLLTFGLISRFRVLPSNFAFLSSLSCTKLADSVIYTI
jgi:hypothetical protein